MDQVVGMLIEQQQQQQSQQQQKDSQKDDYFCPICQETYPKYVSQLLGNIYILESQKCHHNLCSKCWEIFFKDRNEQQCPACKKPLNKKDFKPKYNEQKEFDKEMYWRTWVLDRIGRRPAAKFTSFEEYNYYLEKMEDYILDLVDGDTKEAEKAKQMVEQTKKQFEEDDESQQIDDLSANVNKGEQGKFKLPKVLKKWQKPTNINLDQIQKRQLQSQQYRRGIEELFFSIKKIKKR